VWPHRDTIQPTGQTQARNVRCHNGLHVAARLARGLLYSTSNRQRTRPEDPMNLHSLQYRLIAGSLLATFAIAALAPVANAGHGWGQFRKYRRDDHPVYAGRMNGAPQRVVEFRHHSSGGGSTLAGFLGGIAVGAILTSAAQSHAAARVECAPQPAYCPPPPPAYCPEPEQRYSYEDPFCRERFPSLEVYMAHVRRHGHHALVAQVIDGRDGSCVDVIRFGDGHWESCDRDEQGNWDYEGDE
jgi:hypothetical protein